MSFFNKDEIARMADERRQEEEAAAQAARDKQAREAEEKALAEREVAVLLPFVREALAEFVPTAKQLGTKSFTSAVFVKTPLGAKTKYGRQQIKFDVRLWSPCYESWSNNTGSIYIDERGRTYFGDSTVNRSHYRTTAIFQIPRDDAADKIARTVRSGFYYSRKEYPKGSLLDAGCAKEVVQEAFMEALKL